MTPFRFVVEFIVLAVFMFGSYVAVELLTMYLT